MIQILALAEKNFKAVILTELSDIKENMPFSCEKKVRNLRIKITEKIQMEL